MLRFTSLFFVVLFSFAALAEKKIPALRGPVIDEAQVLKSTEARSLSQVLMGYKDVAQIQVWITKSLEGESIEGLSIRAVDQWKLGDKKKDNGALILIALADRQMRIEIGQGLEGDVPDVVAARIVDYIMAPKFRNGDFYGGLQLAAQEVYVRAGGQGNASDFSKVAPKKKKKSILQGIFMLALFIFFFFARLGFLGPALFMMGGGGRGFGGGGFGGGGGGWSGGGGGFSGGGGSGSW